MGILNPEKQDLTTGIYNDIPASRKPFGVLAFNRLLSSSNAHFFTARNSAGFPHLRIWSVNLPNPDLIMPMQRISRFNELTGKRYAVDEGRFMS